MWCYQMKLTCAKQRVCTKKSAVFIIQYLNNKKFLIFAYITKIHNA